MYAVNDKKPGFKAINAETVITPPTNPLLAVPVYMFALVLSAATLQYIFTKRV